MGDCCRLVELLLANEFEGVLNLASGKSYSFREVLDTVAQISGMNLNVIEKSRSKEKVDNRFDPSLMDAINPNFQWTDLQSGIKQTWEDMSL